MGWFQDYADFVSKIPIVGSSFKPIAQAVKNNDMDSARVQSFISGLPFLGGVVRGIDQARYAEDYYRNTGMAPKYPSLAPGYSGLSTGLGNVAMAAASRLGGGSGYNVKEGTNDLLSFYNYAYV